MSDKAQVGNAADEEQVQKAAENEMMTRDQEISDLVEVLSTPAGRRTFWRILGWCGTEQTPKRETDALTYMAIGSGDAGRWIKSEIIEAGEDLLLLMIKENMEKTKEIKDAKRRRKPSSSSGSSAG